MFKFVNLKEYDNKSYVFLTDTEDLEYQIYEIYDTAKEYLGDTFEIIVDCFLRTGFMYNRFLLLKYVNGEYKDNLIINSRDIPYEIKVESENILRLNKNLLYNSSLPLKSIDIIKSQINICCGIMKIRNKR